MTDKIRRLKRPEYELLAAQGCFDDEKVELLFGMVVEMTPIDPAHPESIYRIRRALERRLDDRARVMSQSPFAASPYSEPEPDLFLVPNGVYWNAHPTRAFLVVEVARSSLRRDRHLKSLLYQQSEVDEYWIVNHVHGVVEVYRDRGPESWRSISTNRRGDQIAPAAFPDLVVDVSEILPPTA